MTLSLKKIKDYVNLFNYYFFLLKNFLLTNSFFEKFDRFVRFRRPTSETKSLVRMFGHSSIQCPLFKQKPHVSDGVFVIIYACVKTITK